MQDPAEIPLAMDYIGVMEIDVVAALRRFMPVDPGVEDIIRKSALVRSYPEGTLVLRQGQPVRECFFVLQGCVRSYLIKDDQEKTLEFYLEDQPIQPVGYGSEAPAENFLECCEPTVMVVTTPDHEAKFLTQFPELTLLCQTMAETLTQKLQSSLHQYRTTTAEERYLDLVQRRPQLLQRIPQYQIASYLGVTPEALSRIRRRIAGGN